MRLSIRQLFLALLFLGLLILTTRPIADPDFWWHLRAGEWMVANHSIPHSDPFSFTVAGKTWVAHEWLSELFIYLLYRLGSYALLTITFAFIITAAFLLTYLRCPNESRPYVAGFVLLLGAVATGPTWGVRPQMISLLLTALFLYLLDRHRKTPRLRYILALPAISLIWVNLHGSFPLGFAVIAVYIMGEAIDTVVGITIHKIPIEVSAFKNVFLLAGVLALCVLTVLANPNSFRLYPYPFETLNSPSMQQFIQEWASPDFHQFEWQPLAWIFLLIIGTGLLGRKSTSITNILLVVAFGYAALRSMRNIPLFALVAVPVLAEQIGSLVRIKPQIQTRSRWFIWLSAAVFLFGILAAGLRFITVIQSQSKTTQETFPAGAADWILANRPSGNLYNTYGWGGYLIWRLYPEYRVYIDGRADVYGDKFIFEYLQIYRAQSDWEKTFSSQGVRLVVVEPGSGLALELRRAPGWAVAYEDQLSVVFTVK